MQKGLPLVAHSNFLVITTSSFTIQLRTSENVLETGDSLWHGAIELVKYLLQHPELVRHRHVLELGAGTGLVGIVAAALGAKSVTITDLECQQSLIQQNIDLNKELWTSSPSLYENSNKNGEIKEAQKSTCQVITKVHRFGEFRTDDWEIEEKDMIVFDTILASDIGYDIELLEPAALSIRHFMMGSPRRISSSSSSSSSVVNEDSECKAVLVEEVRWKDIYTWYKEELIKKCCCEFEPRRILLEAKIEDDNVVVDALSKTGTSTSHHQSSSSMVTISVKNADETLTDVSLTRRISPIMLLTL